MPSFPAAPRALLLTTLALGCSSPPPAGDPRPPSPLATSAAAAPTTPAPPALTAQRSPDDLLQDRLRATADPGGSLPIVVVQGTQILLDGAPAGELAIVAGSLRLQKVDELFAQLKTWREAWKTANPGTAFPGVVGLRASPDTPMVAFKSAYQTAAFSGYPTILLQSPTDPTAIFEIGAQVPGPPPDPSAQVPEPPPTLHLRVHDDVALTWKKGSVVLSEDKAPLAAPDLPDRICTGWKARHPALDPTERRRDELVVLVDNKHPTSTLFPLLRAAETCTRDLREKDGSTKKVPVFAITLSVR